MLNVSMTILTTRRCKVGYGERGNLIVRGVLLNVMKEIYQKCTIKHDMEYWLVIKGCTHCTWPCQELDQVYC